MLCRYHESDEAERESCEKCEETVQKSAARRTAEYESRLRDRVALAMVSELTGNGSEDELMRKAYSLADAFMRARAAKGGGYE